MKLKRYLEVENNLALATKYLGTDIVGLIRSKTPKELISKRTIGGGGTAKYVTGHRFIERLNDCFGFLWSYEVTEHLISGDHIVALGKLTIKVPGQTIVTEYPDGRKETRSVSECSIVKTQFGGSQIKRYASNGKNYKIGDMMDLANDYKGAATDALKKCAIELGIFADVYSSEGDSSGPSEDQLDSLYSRGLKVFKTKEEVNKWCEGEIGCLPQDADSGSVLELIPKLIRLFQEKKAET